MHTYLGTQHHMQHSIELFCSYAADEYVKPHP
jgi:hypothetical protein